MPDETTKSPEALEAEIRAKVEAELRADQPSPATAADGKTMPDNWPCKGYTGPQPWEADNPPELTHDHGLLASGAAGAEVVELAALLAALGYETQISRGQNPHAIFGDSERAAVNQFRADYNVQEAPEVIAATIPSVVGPWTWEALHSAVRDVEGAQG